MNRKELSSRSWLQFDARNQEFVGVPLEEEVRVKMLQQIEFLSTRFLYQIHRLVGKSTSSFAPTEMV